MTNQKEIKATIKSYFNTFILSFILSIVFCIAVMYFTDTLNENLFIVSILLSFISTLYVSYAYLCDKLGFMITSDYIKTLEDAGIEIENITYKRSTFRIFKIDISYDLSKVTTIQRSVKVTKYPIDIPIDMEHQINHVNSMKVVEKTFINNQNNK